MATTEFTAPPQQAAAQAPVSLPSVQPAPVAPMPRNEPSQNLAGLAKMGGGGGAAQDQNEGSLSGAAKSSLSGGGKGGSAGGPKNADGSNQSSVQRAQDAQNARDAVEQEREFAKADKGMYPGTGNILEKDDPRFRDPDTSTPDGAGSANTSGTAAGAQGEMDPITGIDGVIDNMVGGNYGNDYMGTSATDWGSEDSGGGGGAFGDSYDNWSSSEWGADNGANAYGGGGAPDWNYAGYEGQDY